MSISVTPELEQFVTDQVSSGRYQSVSDVVREGLRLLQEREAEQQAALTDIRQKVAVGLDAARRGELLDGEEVFREIEEMSRRRRQSST